ncbi:MAG: phosphodiesterase [Treponema sp.]|nr:phosphodiesterase [Treponema sp.]
MKWMIASDIHGSAKYCRKMIDVFYAEKADRLLLLGDLLYHGPRNDLPEEYNPKRVIEMLNPLKECLLCVRGNCDTEVDQMVLDFPIMADYAVVEMGKNIVYATHGHHFNEENPLPMAEGCILLCGHTHVPRHVKHERFIYMNPGSVSIPKEQSRHSYMVYENGFSWKDLETGSSYAL